MQFMTRAIPRPLAVSVQGLYASITMGVGMGLASLAAGPLYRNFAGSAYLAMTVLGFCGLLAALLLMRRWQGGLIVEARLPLQPS
jgi:PPP family 3-phenylpropionic acid transporter